MINFSTYRASDADEMVGLLGEVFARRDPPAVAVGLTPMEFESFVRLFCPRAAADGLTIVARSTTTGEMIGALLTEDSASAPPDGMNQLSPKFDPIFDILGQLDADYRPSGTVRPGESLHLLLLGVAPHFAGKGVAQELVATCLAHGAGKKYRVAVTEATNTTSQHVFRKQGFVERVRRSYQDHRFNGRTFFKAIADHGGPILMEKQLVLQDNRASDPITVDVFGPDDNEAFGGIRCPLCNWRPSLSSRWCCNCGSTPEPFFEGCGTVWNTFSTHGCCPGCSHQWRWTSCLRCGTSSLHKDWYEERDGRS